MKIVALTADLMDRSKIKAAIPGVQFTMSPQADVVIIDLVSGVAVIAQQHEFAPGARIVCYGPHVATDTMQAARAAGADIVLPRSQFFRDPAAAISFVQ